MFIEKLANTERHLDVAKGHNQRAADKTDELKQLNKSIFRPVVTWNKDGKRAAQEAKVQARYEEEREEREKAMMDIRDSQARIGQAQTYGRGRDGEELVGGSGRFKTAEQLSSRKEQRKRYQFEATASDDEIEDELDDNLGEISEATKRLKALGLAMGSELDNQNARIDRIEGKTVNLDSKIFANTERVRCPFSIFYFACLQVFFCSSRRSSSGYIVDILLDTYILFLFSFFGFGKYIAVRGSFD